MDFSANRRSSSPNSSRVFRYEQMASIPSSNASVAVDPKLPTPSSTDSDSHLSPSGHTATVKIAMSRVVFRGVPEERRRLIASTAIGATGLQYGRCYPSVPKESNCPNPPADDRPVG